MRPIDEGHGISLKTFAAHPERGDIFTIGLGGEEGGGGWDMNVPMFRLKWAMFILYL